MGIVDMGLAFVAAAIADLRGDESTRPFTRRAFLLLVLLEAGLALSGLESTLATIISMFGGII